ncbi:MAG: flagellar FliJ family protein [Pseudomonadota bacterium]
MRRESQFKTLVTLAERASDEAGQLVQDARARLAQAQTNVDLLLDAIQRHDARLIRSLNQGIHGDRLRTISHSMGTLGLGLDQALGQRARVERELNEHQERWDAARSRAESLRRFVERRAHAKRRRQVEREQALVDDLRRIATDSQWSQPGPLDP